MRIQFLITVLITFSCFAGDFSNFSFVNDAISSSISKSIPSSELNDFSNIYEQIDQSYESNYDQIGTRLANASNSGLFGGLNMIGYKHANKFSSFKISFNRSIAPALYNEDKFIVNDEVIIEIDAARFLKKLSDENVIRISETNLKAFAGLAFKRTMRFNHFADTKQEGLYSGHDKLFLMFRYFLVNKLQGLSEYDYLTKEDSFTVSAGGYISAPIYTYGSIGVGALYKYEKKSRITIQKLGADDSPRLGEDLRISVEDSKMTTAGGNVTLVADFFKILKLTLLSYDLEYSKKKTSKTYMSLYRDDYQNELKLKQLSGILRFKDFNYDLFSENITSKESRIKEIQKSKYTFLFFGGIKKSQSENIEIVKDGILYRFFSHTYEKLKYKENYLSRIITNILGKLIGYDQLAKRTQVQQRLVNINYESKRNIMRQREDFNIFDTNVFTMELGVNLKLMPSKQLSSKKVKAKLKTYIASKTGSYSKFKKILEQNKLSAPSEFKAKYVMDNTNVDFFMRQNSTSIYAAFDTICKVKSKGVFRWFRSLFNGCKNKLYKSYSVFLKEWSTANYTRNLYKKCSRKYRWKYIFKRRKKRKMISKCMEISSRIANSKKIKKLPLWRFKDVVTNLSNNFNNISELKRVFGEFNRRGSINVIVNDTIDFRGHYNEGPTKDNIVNQFKMDNQLRSPASLE